MPSHHTVIQNIQYFFVCLFFASLNFEMFSPIVPDFSVAKMAVLLYISVSLLTPKNLLSVKNIRLPLFSIFAMFFLMVTSSIIHMQINYSIFDTTIFLNIIMFWLLLNHHRRDNRVFHEGMLWFSVTSFMIGVFYLLGIGVAIGDDMRIVVFGENANVLGIKMSVGALFMMYYCLCHAPQKPIYRPWLLLLIIPMVLLMLATASRVSLLVLGSGTILFVLLRPSKTKGLKILWLIIGFCVLYFGYQYILEQEVLMKRVDRTIEEGSLSGRDYIWEKYLELITEHPLLGVGFTGANQYSKEVLGSVKSPHNVLIEVALYSGFLGLMCFAIFLFGMFRDAWYYYKNNHILGPLITSMAIVGMVLSGQALGVKLFWVLAAYAFSYRLIHENSSNHVLLDR